MELVVPNKCLSQRKKGAQIGLISITPQEHPEGVSPDLAYMFSVSHEGIYLNCLFKGQHCVREP